MLRLYTIFYLVCTVASANIDCTSMTRLCIESSENCDKCISANACCIWMSGVNVNISRCNVLENIPKHVDINTIIGIHSEAETTKDEEFSLSKSNEDKPAVQIRPQKVKVYLRKGQSINITLKYKAAENYPLDLYYLTDFTFSMRPHINQLQNLGNKLTEQLKKLTTMYKLALGYFSDKVLMPFSDMVESMQENPCQHKGQPCHKAFNFVHALNFTANANEFLKEIDKSKLTANIDEFDGGLDALMQIIACQTEVGWRKYSRKIVILATDGLLHSAGNGVLAGVVARNSGKCELVHADGKLIYDGLTVDYPSFEEIDRKLQKMKTSVLFVAQDEEIYYYEAIHSLMPHITYLGKLNENTDNVLELLETAYRSKVQNVRFQSGNEDNIKVTFWTNCNQNKWQEMASCDNVKLDTEYEFNVTIELLEYKGERSVFQIEEMNIEEMLEVTVENTGVCNCNEDNDDVCNHGKLKCGICECEPKWFGERCNKKCENVDRSTMDCMNRGDFDSDTCKCSCDLGYNGPKCEYDDCPRNNKGYMCNRHGSCLNGKCNCDSGYKGMNCECSESTSTCTAPGDSVLCSGHGNCICGKCECDASEHFIYQGRYCHECPQCETLCNVFNEIVIAKLDGRPTSTNTSEAYKITEVDELTQSGRTQCFAAFYKNDEQCKIDYTYTIAEVIFIEAKLRCSKPIGAASIGIGIIVIMVSVLAVMLSIWKISVTIKDKKEYAEFVKKANAQELNSFNPLYRNPITEFKNPIKYD